VAVSGGSDSMALLDMCYKLQMQIVVAHVNYQKRESALRDEKGVEAYCLKHNIPFFKHVVTTYEKGNFQAVARKIRYAFFKDVVKHTNAKGVLVAHHMDDVLETYIMQKQRGSIPSFYGIAKDTRIDGVRIVRLLLDSTKEELERYCIENKVPYFVDESNLSDAYTRNQIRHKQVEQMSIQKKQDMMKWIQEENKQLQKETCKVEEFCMGKDVLNQVELVGLSPSFLTLVLRYWIIMHTGYHQISKKHIQQIIKLLDKPHWVYPVNKEYQLVCAYENISIQLIGVSSSFSYLIQKIEFKKYEHFEIASTGKKIEGVCIKEEDYPLTIRNALPKDKIELRYGTKKVSRFLIDRKIPKKEREVWPVLVNNMGKVIFVCGIGCDIAHYSNNFNMFVVK